ncbi:MAG: PilN domain-containing protein [Candidatus Eisenbacteria bacterium]|uniref:PilN domain-containing protein n=1 Tax=Eiseniibacteriota bacterium TaxID=2212470 RepID=A0A538UED8_UNCEI|nr:MAG: PilN domain-containing protein [Candidatus Eisenbacteria bacterium]
MIRINLLPREERVQRRSTMQWNAGEMVIPVGVVVATLLIVAGFAVSQHSRVASLTRAIADKDAESRALAPQIERVNRLAQERAELDLRLGIINKLQKGRTQSVRVMDELARCVPDHLWMTLAQQDAGSQLDLEGVTYSNLVVSDFMSRLERSPMFANVELGVAETGEISDHNVVKFHITCQVTPDEPAN